MENGVAEIISSTFIYNQGRRGGAVSSNVISLSINNTLFDQNIAQSGGGIFTYNTVSEIDTCEFYRNQASLGGGGIFVQNGESITLFLFIY